MKDCRDWLSVAGRPQGRGGHRPLDRVRFTAVGLSFALACWVTPVVAENLNAAWSSALANNSRLAAAEYQSNASAYDLESARAERLPDISLRGSYDVRSDTRNFRVENPLLAIDRFPYAQREAAIAEAQVLVPVYTSGRIKSFICGAQAELSASQHEAAATRADLLSAVGEAYLSVLRAQRELKVAQQDLASLSAHEAEVKCLFDQQRVPRNDLLAAQVTTAAASQSCLRGDHRLLTASATYNRLLGRPLATPFHLEEFQFLYLPYNLEQLKQIAWQRRPELLALRASADSRYFEAQRLTAARRPQVSLVGRYQFEENRFQDPQGISSAAVVVDWNPFDGGRKARAADAELSRAASLRQSLEDFKSQVALDLLSFWNNRQEASGRLEVASQTVEHADENLRVARLRYARGMAVQSEVLDAQSRKSQVTRDYFNAGYDVALSQLHLRYAAGMLEDSLGMPTVETLPPPSH
jgi:outer membrane protein